MRLSPGGEQSFGRHLGSYLSSTKDATEYMLMMASRKGRKLVPVHVCGRKKMTVHVLLNPLLCPLFLSVHPPFFWSFLLSFLPLVYSFVRPSLSLSSQSIITTEIVPLHLSLSSPSPLRNARFASSILPNHARDLPWRCAAR